MDSRPPLELGGRRRSVIRLNRRLLYVVIAVLAVTVGVAVYAIRTQGTQFKDPGTEPRTPPAPSSAPWFQGVPEYQAPPQRAAILDTASLRRRRRLRRPQPPRRTRPSAGAVFCVPR
jgi:hypothetical protein